MPETSRSHRAHFCTLQIQPFTSVETIRRHSRLYSGRECGPEALDCSPRRMIAVSGAVNCCGLHYLSGRLAIECHSRPTIIDSRRGLRPTLIASEPTLFATTLWRVLPVLYGEFFGR
jgi:hypothetical protein